MSQNLGVEDGTLYSSRAEAELAIASAYQCGDLNFEDEVWLAAHIGSDKRLTWRVVRDEK